MEKLFRDDWRPTETTRIPHISFPKQQLGLVLGAIDRLCKNGISRHSDLIFPIVFRILIGCGTRITETLHIEKNDIDLESGTLISTPYERCKGTDHSDGSISCEEMQVISNKMPSLSRFRFYTLVFPE